MTTESSPHDSESSTQQSEENLARAYLDGQRTFPHWIQQHARHQPDKTAITFLSDEAFDGVQPPTTLTYGQLWQSAIAVSQKLSELPAFGLVNANASAEPVTQAPRVAMVYPAGIDFVISFLGIQLAGGVPVPTAFPKPHREIPRLNAAARDCNPAVIVSDAATLETFAKEKLAKSTQEIEYLATDELPSIDQTTADTFSVSCQPEAIALLQYTSGSTSDPKGVVIRHRNLMANLEAIRQGFSLAKPNVDSPSNDAPTAVFWLPFYHDMGLVGSILEPLFLGGHSVLLSPASFLRRPSRWLSAITQYKASVSGAPNFAYQLCVDRIPPEQTGGLDLTHWKLAFCGAEPISARTLAEFESRFASNGFAADAFYPCYGMAEATLLITGGDGPAKPTVATLRRDAYQRGEIKLLDRDQAKQLSRRDRTELVGCGTAVTGTELVIVDPATTLKVDELTIGEIWVRGDSVSDGYWLPNSIDRFDAQLADSPDTFCRTGDLGFIHRGNLFVTGRTKEMVILRGRNLFPQDIEATSKRGIRDFFKSSTDSPEESTGSIGNSAAFSVDGLRGEALAVIAEVPRTTPQDQLVELARSIRRNIIEVHDVDPQHIWLVRPATVPVTTSGKIRRSECKTLFGSDAIQTRYRYDRSAITEQAPIPFPELPPPTTQEDRLQLQSAIEEWMQEWLMTRAGVTAEEYDRETPLSEFGLDSLTAVELSGETEDWTGVLLTPEVASENPTVALLARYIAANYRTDC